jgi:hypothetical protein
MWKMRRGGALAIAAALGVIGPSGIGPACGAPVGTSYYVSPTGNDHASGSSASPWQTLERVSTANLEPGDHVYLQGGATFTGTLRLTAEDSGTATNPVVIDSYGTGRAIISSGTAQGVSVYDAAGVEVHDLKIAGAGRDGGGDVGLLFFNDLAGNVLLPYLRVSDVEVSGYHNFGIAIGGWNGTSGFSDVRVERVASHDNGDSGMVTYAAARNVHKNVYVGSSSFSNNQGLPDVATNTGSGLVLGGVDGATVEKNVAFKNGGLNTTIQGGVGIWTYNSNKVVIQRNESYGNRTGSAADGGGFDLDLSVSNSVLQFNYSHDNAGNGLMLAHGLDTTAHTNNVVRYNVSQNDARKNGTGAIRIFGRINNAEIYQNTISLSATTSVSKAIRIDGKQPATKVHFRNNIFRTKGGAPLLLVSPLAVSSAVDLRFQGNDWFAAGATPKFIWGSKTFTSLTAWRTASGAEKVGTKAVGTSADPQFVGGDAPTLGNPAKLVNLRNYYDLSVSSTIIDKGLNLATFGITPSSVDFAGDPTPTGSAPDPGAFER